MIKLTLNPAQIDKALNRIASAAPKAVARAMNRATGSARSVMVKAVAEDLGIKQAAVRKQITTINASASKLQSALECSGARIPLIEFGARGPEPSRGRGRGVSYKLPGGAGRLPHAFIATMPSGHRGVYQRAGKTRLKIIEQRGPSMPHVFSKFHKETIAAYGASFAKNLDHELSRELQKAVA